MQAKRNLVNEYFLVGVTEEMNEFIALLELSLPRIFKNAQEQFSKSNRHLRKTKNKKEPEPETIKRIQESRIWQMETELYEFALEHFHFIQSKYFVNGKKQEYMYEKIKPNLNQNVKS